MSFASGGHAIYYVILHPAEARSLVSFTSVGQAIYYIILQPGGKEFGESHQWWARVLFYRCIIRFSQYQKAHLGVV